MADHRKKYYTIYLRKNDKLIVSGTSFECAKVLNHSLNGFYSMISRNRKGIQNKYDIIIDYADSLEESEA